MREGHRCRAERLTRLIAICSWLFCLCEASARADWPMHRADAARSGYTAESLPKELHASWVYRAPHSPRVAWPRSDRQTFDRAPQPVIFDGLAYWGDTVSGVVTAVDMQTGAIVWEFFTDGPVRFAPVVFENLLYATSDDGFLYALNRQDGSLAWKHRGGPDHNKRLGNERMISRWPARGGAVVLGETVYYAAGIWPSDGIYLHALDARGGEPIWVNDKSGSLYMPQPHGGADAESGVAAQGHLVAVDTSGELGESSGGINQWLLVPTGRAVPAVFDRKTGAFQYFHLQKYGHKGGANVVASRNHFINSGMLFALDTGEGAQVVGAGPVVATPGGLVKFVEGKLAGFRWETVEKQDRKGGSYTAPSLVPLWSVGELPSPHELIMAGTTVIVGADREVLAVDQQTQQLVWRTQVDGSVFGLAASDGRLLVSTDQGTMYCFQATPSAEERKLSPVPRPAGQSVDAEIDQVAERILRESNMKEGYCLDLGCGDGRLAEALARRSQLQIVAVESDPALLSQARRRLHDGRLLGARVTVLSVAELSETGLPNYFANLIVSQRALTEGRDWLPASEMSRLLRPYGGVSLVGTTDRLERDERGPLAGAGQWTHQYATAGNATCSTDELVKGPLGLLWFRDIDVEMPQRHGRGPGPLFYDGRLYSMGMHELACVDAYNGRLLWKYPLPDILKAYDGDELMGTAGTHGNYCMSESGVYVRREGHCLRIDRVTGKLLGKFDAPLMKNGKPGTWGYVACQNGVLLGSLADSGHVVTFRYVNRGGDLKSLLTESETLFALDAESGNLLWRYDARDSLRHNAIAFDGEGVYLIDRPLALADRVKNAKVEEHRNGMLVALDARSGKVRWRNENQIDGTLLALSEQHPVLMMGGQPTRFALESERGDSLATFDLTTGEERWRKKTSYASRPMINDRTIYAQGGAWDLMTGYELPFEFKRSYGCGVLAGSKHTMVFRSATLGYFDFERQGKVENFGGVRPGCWINAIPAGGLVLVPDASAGCVCSYLNQTWFALEPDGLHPPRVSPPGGAFRKEIDVTLTPDEAGQVVHYTWDGSEPGKTSPVYSGPLKVTANATLKARSFDKDGRAGRIAEVAFVIDPLLLPIEDSHWRQWDVSGAGVSSAPGRWAVKDGVVSQTSNIYQESANDVNPLTERYGTLRIYAGAHEFADGVFDLQIRSEDDDGIGAVFRCRDERHHYLFHTDKQRNFSILAVKNGAEYRVLATTDQAYQPGKWHQYRLRMHGEHLQVELDGKLLLEARDATFPAGTIGLHCWGSDKVQFRAMRLEAGK